MLGVRHFDAYFKNHKFLRLDLCADESKVKFSENYFTHLKNSQSFLLNFIPQFNFVEPLHPSVKN